LNRKYLLNGNVWNEKIGIEYRKNLKYGYDYDSFDILMLKEIEDGWDVEFFVSVGYCYLEDMSDEDRVDVSLVVKVVKSFEL